MKRHSCVYWRNLRDPCAPPLTTPPRWMDRSGPFSILPSGTSARDATQRFLVFSVTYISPYNQQPRTNTLICTHPVHCNVARGTHRSRLPAGDVVQSVPLLFVSLLFHIFYFSSPITRMNKKSSCTCWMRRKESTQRIFEVISNFDGWVGHLIHSACVSVQGSTLNLLHLFSDIKTPQRIPDVG